jgi:NifB/MoaA-like Fe-S oxidoreductase
MASPHTANRERQKARESIMNKREVGKRLERLEQAASTGDYTSGVIIFPGHLSGPELQAWLQQNPQYQACKAAGHGTILLPEKRPMLYNK